MTANSLIADFRQYAQKVPGHPLNSPINQYSQGKVIHN